MSTHAGGNLRQDLVPWSTFRRHWLLPLMGVALLLGAGRSEAQEYAQGGSQKFELWIGSDDAREQIINGVAPAEPDKWRSIFLSLKGNAWCTAFAVGPRTLMTAAHCVPNDQKIVIKRPGKDDLVAECKTPASFPSDVTADYALCILKTDISSGPFETLNRDRNRLVPDSEVLLTGYGCTQFTNPGQQTFSTGQVKFVSSAEGNYALMVGAASVCFGDSGGPAFIASKDDLANRVLIGVNSQGWEGSSSLISLVPSSVEIFFQAWSDNGGTICGITPDAKKCRHE